MKIFNRKLIVSALAFVMIMALAGLPLAARGRRGATVTVTLADGKRVTGELLAVKGSDLIIQDRSSDRGFTVNIEQTSEIKIKKKSRILSGLAIGIAAGVVIGFLGYAKQSEHYMGVFPILVTPCFTAPIGGLIDVFLSLPKIMAIKGRTPVQIESCLLYLQQYARY